MCDPFASVRYVFGDRQGAQRPLSSLHSKTAAASLEVKRNVVVLLAVVPAGPAVIRLGALILDDSIVSSSRCSVR